MADNEKVNLGTDGAELSFTKRYDAPTVCSTLESLSYWFSVGYAGDVAKDLSK